MKFVIVIVSLWASLTKECLVLSFATRPTISVQRSFSCCLFSEKTDETSKVHEALVLTDDATESDVPLSPTTTTPTRTRLFMSDDDATLSSSQAFFLLNAVAVIWGTQHSVIKMVVDDADPGIFTLVRFGLAALIACRYTPSLLQGSTEKDSLAQTDTSDDDGFTVPTVWRWGLELGFWMFCGYFFQAVGLEFTTAQKSGFLLYLNVKFVPLFARILLGRQISVVTWVSAITAFTGTFLLAFSVSSGTIDFNIGDLWSIAAAAASAMFILRLEQASIQVADAAALNAACLWVVFFLSGTWTLGVNPLFHPDQMTVSWQEIWNVASSHVWELVYLSGVTTALANLIQTKAQRYVSAERASLVYAMDPVYGAFFSWILLGETLESSSAWLGAFLITAAAGSSAILDKLSESEQKEDAVQ